MVKGSGLQGFDVLLLPPVVLRLEVPSKDTRTRSVVVGLQLETFREPVTGGRMRNQRSGKDVKQSPRLGKLELEAPTRD
jgi:hypothetical protein